MGMQMHNPVAMFVLYLYRKLNITFVYYLYIYAEYRKQYGDHADYCADLDEEFLRFRYFVRSFKPDVKEYRSFRYSESDAREAVEYLARIYSDFPLEYGDFTSELFRGAAAYDDRGAGDHAAEVDTANPFHAQSSR